MLSCERVYNAGTKPCDAMRNVTQMHGVDEHWRWGSNERRGRTTPIWHGKHLSDQLFICTFYMNEVWVWLSIHLPFM